MSEVWNLLHTSYSRLLAADYELDVLARAFPLLTRGLPELLMSGHFYVAESSDHRLVGCGGWSRELPGTTAIVPGLAHVRHFATHPDWLRRGIARSIFARCIQDAQADHVERFLCFSTVSAEPFFEAMGLHALKNLNLRLTTEIALAAAIMEGNLRQMSGIVSPATSS